MRKLVMVALLASVAVFFLGMPALAEPVDVGTISGTVTDQDSSEPIMGARVKAYRTNGHFWPAATAWTDSAGNYELTVPYGDYHVKAEKWGYYSEWWQEVQHREDATAVTVDEANNPDNIDFTLADYASGQGSISGTVTAAGSNEPISGATLILRKHNSYYWMRFTHSGDDGGYTFANVPAGTYSVRCHKEGYLPAVYPDSIVIDGNDVTGIDFALEELVFGGIAGIVSDAATSEPIGGAWIIATNIDNPHYHRWARSDENGEYSMELVSGSYHLEARATGYYPSSPDSPVVVVDTVVTVDFSMTAIDFGSISGTVYDTTTGETVARALVEARMIGSYYKRHTRSDSSGNYTLEMIVPGNYRVSAFAHGYAPKAYPDTVSVGDGQNVTDIDFYLTPITPPFDGYISGMVTDEQDSQPIADALVVAFGFGHPRHYLARFTRTAADGSYIFENLPPINFKVLSMAHGYVPEFYDNKSNWFEADLVTPDADSINFALTPDSVGARTLAGHIFEDGIPVTGAIVMAKDGEELRGITVSYPDGSYIFDGLEAGTYSIEVISPSLNQGSLSDVMVLFTDIYNADIILAPTSVDDDNVNLPVSATLMQNYPNPFNASTSIGFNLTENTNVELSVYDLLGRQVITLVSGDMPAGQHTVTWNGSDGAGNQVATGLYLYVLKTDNEIQRKHMLLLK